MVESKKQWKAWLYLAPAIVLLLIFTVWPIINTLRMAFLNGYNYSAAKLTGAKYTFGIENFKNVLFGAEGGTVNFFDSDFFIMVKNTVLLCVLTVPLSTILALLIAIVLNSIKPFRSLLQTIYFLPYVTNSIAIGMVFYTMFGMVGDRLGTDFASIDTVGLMNTLLQPLLSLLGKTHGVNGTEGGLSWLFCSNEGRYYINWVNMGSGYWQNMAVMVVYIVWNALPFKILILLGGLQSINKQYYDAAKVDGTPKWRVATRITVPLLSPMIAYVVITGFIGGFKEYNSIVAIFDESMGPTGASGRLNTMVGYIYECIDGSRQGQDGNAAAAALLLFVLIFIVTMINMQVSKKRVHY